ncbi:MAG TPA: hypothetical protein VFK10_04430, partial [Burkholderiaceae bacterium]|nr:hypothetical protein [Burkholderiaceae bacterium]
MAVRHAHGNRVEQGRWRRAAALAAILGSMVGCAQPAPPATTAPAAAPAAATTPTTTIAAAAAAATRTTAHANGATPTVLVRARARWVPVAWSELPGFGDD